jgi:hypothetical protein
MWQVQVRREVTCVTWTVGCEPIVSWLPEVDSLPDLDTLGGFAQERGCPDLVCPLSVGSRAPLETTLGYWSQKQ